MAPPEDVSVKERIEALEEAASKEAAAKDGVL